MTLSSDLDEASQSTDERNKRTNNVHSMMMQTRKLILLMLALLWFVPSKAEMHSSFNCNLVDKTAAERPQWSEMGMCDLLAAPGATSLTPPSTVRIVSQNPSSAAPLGDFHQRTYALAAYLPPSRPNRTHRGYIYMLRCLRL